MPLETLKLSGQRLHSCKWRIDTENFAHLSGMPLTRLDLGCFYADPVDGVLEHLRGLPLTGDESLEMLKGMALTDVSISHYSRVTDAGVEHLLELPLTRLSCYGCDRISNECKQRISGIIPNCFYEPLRDNVR